MNGWMDRLLSVLSLTQSTHVLPPTLWSGRWRQCTCKLDASLQSHPTEEEKKKKKQTIKLPFSRHVNKEPASFISKSIFKKRKQQVLGDAFQITPPPSSSCQRAPQDSVRFLWVLLLRCLRPCRPPWTSTLRSPPSWRCWLTRP